jgi:5-methylcytosine-specific restriction protein A
MPFRPKRPCPRPGCGALVESGYCPKHRRELSKEQNADRLNANARGYGRRWQKARAAYLRRHPLCVDHESRGELVASSQVDHIVPHNGNQRLFWDSENNWAALCESCHSRKTAREDGGFGNVLSER